jgi:hypothetical protein
MNDIKVWQIGPDGTEYYAARSEAEMREWYLKEAAVAEEAEEDLRDHFEEVTHLDAEITFNDDGEIRQTTWRKLAEEHAEHLPTQISTGYN